MKGVTTWSHQPYRPLEFDVGDVYICRLRKKLEEPTGIKIITTVREKGYALSLKINVIPSKKI